MSPEAHDAAFAAVSHLPHLMAFALMHGITNQPWQGLPGLAGPGFRDFTRIAASDPKMWRDILLPTARAGGAGQDVPAQPAACCS
jgi:prephenate dehydrogenase